MNIVKPYARLLTINGQEECSLENGIKALRHIEFCGRVSHRSEEAQTAQSWDKFIRSVVLGHGDWSIVEHASATVDALVDRGITHEWVRHRLFSYTQESTRFVNYEKKMPASFIQPATGIEEVDRLGDLVSPWYTAIEHCERAYKTLLRMGVAPQIARSVFPNALASRIIVTGNIRNWRHIFLLRTTKEAHPQMREVMIPLLKEFQEKIPILFEDIEPLARQIDNMRKPR